MLTVVELIEQIRPSVNEVSVADFKKRLKQAGALLIDIREPNEFAAGAIEGAINIPRGILESQITALCQKISVTAPADVDILIYCRSGARGVLAAESLQRMGYNHVVNLIGGIVAWQQ
ncbi:rhodanese-like domain-containing protein [Algibacillus agarilyticus]|uniref:rhodanese-like domain-containing protein n=1 Tax=Algibacillus agarilyticus TaxID=2234133 RepID=UPI000DD09A4D|nr:rhodanese-like domain-containing protein [Algibacillus agarilyticus]